MSGRDTSNSTLPRLVVLAGAAVAATGGGLIYLEARDPGAPAALTPVFALLAGAVAFAIGARRLDRLPAREGSEVLAGIPRGLEVPRESRGGLMLALAVCALATVLYAVVGYTPFVLAGWLAGWVVATRALWPARRPVPRHARLRAGEIAFISAVMAGLALLVLPYLATLPYEISTDEIFSIRSVRDFVDGTATDPLGLVSWWGLPALYFALTALVAGVIGTSVEAIRTLTAVTAIATVVPFYLWVRTLHGRNRATLAIVMFAFAHAFIGWGRIALHQNSPVLLLAVGMALLAVGMRDGCPVKTLWGGIAMGLGFHTYPSGQIIVLIWGGALVAALALRSVKWRDIAPVVGLSFLGFVLAMAPMLVSIIGSWDAYTARAAAVAMTNPEAIALLGRNLGLDETAAIVRENVTRGLLSFNGAYPYVTYFNPGHGFVDPATGVLLWLGLGTALTRRKRFGTVLACVGFAAVYAVGFLTEGAPVHGRLLIALPFVVVLAVEALGVIGRAIAPLGADNRRRLASAFLVSFIVLNLVIFHNYVGDQMTRARSDEATAVGRSLGVGVEMTNPVGRFLGQEPRWDPGTLVVLVSEEEYPVFRWADEQAWRTWLGFFSQDSRVEVVAGISEFIDQPPGTFAHGFWNRAILFMRREVWSRDRARLFAAYPDLRHEPVTSNRRLVAVHLSR